MLKKYEESNIQAIANKIREKTGTDNTYKTSEMASGVDEVFKAGRGDVLDNSKYIEKSAIGKLISLNDVSEVYHKVKVYADEPTEVDVYGKNLFPSTALDISNYISIAQSTYVYELPTIGIGTYYFSATPLLSAETLYQAIYFYLQRKPLDGSSDWSTCENIIGGTENVKTPLITIEVGYQYRFWAYVSRNLFLMDAFENVQLEVGTSASPYEPYTHQTITATSNGTEANSICPNMTFIADSDITVDYYSSFGMAEKELAMWNAFTNNGNRKNFDYAFDEGDYTGYTIPSGLCKPRQRIGAMFYNYKGTELPKGVDCSEFDITDTLKNNHCVNTFAYAQKIKHVYDMLIPAVRYYNATFSNCPLLEFIEIIRANENTIFDTNCFNKCTALTHVIFSGVIVSDINLQWSSLLDDETLISLSVALGDLAKLNLSNKTVTLHANCIARLKELPYPQDETYNPSGDLSCYDVIVTAKGWNIA